MEATTGNFTDSLIGSSCCDCFWWQLWKVSGKIQNVSTFFFSSTPIDDRYSDTNTPIKCRQFFTG